MTATKDGAYLRLYEPLDTLKPVADDLYVVDGPIIRMALAFGLSVPFPTRMAIVRLSDGGLFVHSPTRLTPALAAAVRSLGPVRHLVSPNLLHYAAIPEWAAAFPEATTWASPGVRERAASQHIAVHFDRDLAATPDPAWADDIDQLIFAGSFFLREVVFFHRRSRTVLLADLIENFELPAVAPRWHFLLRLAGCADPDGKAPLDLRMTFLGRRAAARRSLAQVLAWAPERVIVGHGRWYPEDGTAELKRAFRWLG